MKINSINNIYNKIIPFNKNIINPITNNKLEKSPIGGDVVSFGAKKYDAESIVNPTYHCAYCGSKVYTEQQLDSIAKEILSSKADRLDGKIKSVIEKLEEAKHSEELSVAKRIENEEEIKFFQKFLEVASKKSFMKGEAIFESVYNLDSEQALALLLKNLHPLMRTIDHVSPQKEDKENHNADINLVESCYCCNHDLKRGSSFSEFYTMFPTIKNNMPGEKFQYAASKLLDSSQSNIIQRLSATNMLKMIERLFVQRKEAENNLSSIDFRIQGCRSGIDDSLESCRKEIADKEAEVSELQAKLDELTKDDEYVALLKRMDLTSQLDSVKEAIGDVSDKKSRISNQINEIRNAKSSKKKKEELSPEEKEAKIKNLKNALMAQEHLMDTLNERKFNIEVAIADLDKEFPTIEIYQSRKNQAESVINAYMALIREQSALDKNQNTKTTLEERINSLNQEISSIKEKDFNPDSLSDEDRQIYDRYRELQDAIKFIDEHPNGGTVKVIINQAAKMQIAAEINSLKDKPVIVHYQTSLRKTELKSQLDKVKTQKTDVEKQISASKNQIQHFSAITKRMTREDAEKQSKDSAEAVRRLTEKSNNIKIPQIISTIRAEITLLNQTIVDLQNKMAQIESSYKSET